MTLEITNEFGSIDISNDVIATIAGGAAVECYGIIGMASKHQVRDGIADILRRDNYSKGVIVSQKDDKLDVDMYIIVAYGTKISEIANNVQSAVKYTLEKALNLKVNSVNIYIQGVRVIKLDEEE
ncbi:Asp23/Gls24 family envelope stress response protein [Macrococcus equipercicus]|uniref:Asp23/Gls24 family envelope stress response protein n=1 Tax=Macrococcus equipercicus TaxID=69967 RepID=A0A9Q9BWH7_9STAP|nr:Asp23/Gls24 family envelope stress response protein [Macrococcus equipercicus]KAA1042761.1 Asp23/Gls24 family envelope stress response protein [Macrococcus equipercicus]UTH14627.1 Asp23/Gls24 family envelope stress response protein [Macrococcus equipercicus]